MTPQNMADGETTTSITKPTYAGIHLYKSVATLYVTLTFNYNAI